MPPLTPADPAAQQLRKQILGVLIIAAIVLIFTAVRAGWHAIIPPGWWRH